MKCETCHRNLVRKRVDEYPYDESGVPNVILCEIDVLECPECGDRSPLIPAISRVHEALAEAIALKPEPLVGKELRFLRKQMKLTGRQFARLIGVDATQVSRWENGRAALGNSTDRLVRYLYFRYIEEVQERTIQKDIIDEIAAIHDRDHVVEVKMPSHNPTLYSYSCGDDFAPA